MLSFSAGLLFALSVAADITPGGAAIDARRFVEVGSAPAAAPWLPGAGRYACARKGNEVEVIDTRTGATTGSLSGHAGGIHDGGWSANGKILATSGSDGSVKVWDVASLEELASIEMPNGFA
ncbi:MAG: hypothetical protein HY716_02460 [Planctomycetes bacterium]|nr:hypothetical protein [Planctomycetota bacterium]